MRTKIIIFLSLCLLIGLLFIYRQYLNLQSVSNYGECIKSSGSRILESYPAICVTRLGKQFTEPVIPDSSETMSPVPSAIPLPSATSSIPIPTIITPSENADIVSPITVRGVVPSGWMFEGVMPIKILDEKKEVIVQGQAKELKPGSWQRGNPVEFTATLTFTASAKNGFIVIAKDNPSGLPANDESYQIPVLFSK